MENTNQTLLEKVAAYAIETYPEDQEKAAAFVDGFIKEAMNMPTGGFRGHPETLPGKFFGELTSGFGKSLGGTAVTLGALGVGAAMNHFKSQGLHAKFLQALSTAIANNRNLKMAPHDKVMSYAESIFKFAPNVATDSNLLTSILSNAILGDGIDPNTIKMLGDMEQRYQGNTSLDVREF